MRRLEAAGYAVAGKTNLHEFAYGISSQNPHFGTVPNPALPGRLAGGSSGGSAAAVAAGDVELALGTDSAGSIRIPAAWCGVVGFKPTHGLVSGRRLLPARAELRRRRPDRVVGRGLRGLHARARARVPAGRARVARGARGRSRVARRGGAARARAASRRRRSTSRAGASSTCRSRRRTAPTSCARSADVHRALFPGNEELYGENVRGKIERCLEVTDAEAAAAARERARVPRAVRGGARGHRSASSRRPSRSSHRRPTSTSSKIRAPGDRVHVSVQLARLAGARAPVRPGGGRAACVGAARRARGRGCAASSPRAGCWSCS